MFSLLYLDKINLKTLIHEYIIYVYPIAYPLIREDCSLQTKFDPVILVSGMAKCS